MANNVTTWARITALVVVMTKAMGASQWSWWLTIGIVAGLLGVSPVMAWLRSRKSPPRMQTADGGDIILTPGAPGEGGRPGRIILRGFQQSRAPFLSIEQIGALESLDIYVGLEWPSYLKVKNGSVYLKIDELKLLRCDAGSWREIGRATDSR